MGTAVTSDSAPGALALTSSLSAGNAFSLVFHWRWDTFHQALVFVHNCVQGWVSVSHRVERGVAVIVANFQVCTVLQTHFHRLGLICNDCTMQWCASVAILFVRVCTGSKEYLQNLADSIVHSNMVKSRQTGDISKINGCSTAK